MQQAIILCGGKGTRLKDAIPKGLPKAMADICGKPFLWYLLGYWEQYVDTFILATGFGHSKIEKYFGDSFGRSKIIYSESTSGTDYAVERALKEVTTREVFIINGDTFFKIYPPSLLTMHREKGTYLTLSYSTQAEKHAGVDMLTIGQGNRASIYPCSEYFIDIGTPDKLEEFRKRVYTLISHEDTCDLQHL